MGGQFTIIIIIIIIKNLSGANIYVNIFKCTKKIYTNNKINMEIHISNIKERHNSKRLIAKK